MALIPVKRGEIAIGTSIPWPLYDRERNRVRSQGSKIDTADELELLMEDGLFHGASDSAAVPGGPGATTRPDPVADGGNTHSLDEIHLQIGDTLQLQSLTAGEEDRHYVRLIGLLKGGSVIVTTPTANGMVLLIREGRAFLVRFFSGKSAYAFTTHVVKSVGVPYPHLHLTYPNTVKGQVVRRNARADVKIIAVVNTARDAAPQAVTLSNISIGGTQVVSKRPIAELGERITVKFRVFVREIERVLIVDAMVRSAARETDTAGALIRVLYGVEFVDLRPDDLLALTAFVYQSLIAESSTD
jgi:c-di-GMP-binding flagellar brake protein YcgR